MARAISHRATVRKTRKVATHKASSAKKVKKTATHTTTPVVKVKKATKHKATKVAKPKKLHASHGHVTGRHGHHHLFLF